jgi:hypothetical protein
MTPKELFSVWVGGSEVNDYYLTKSQADSMAAYWLALGYDATLERLSA